MVLCWPDMVDLPGTIGLCERQEFQAPCCRNAESPLKNGTRSPCGLRLLFFWQRWETWPGWKSSQDGFCARGLSAGSRCFLRQMSPFMMSTMAAFPLSNIVWDSKCWFCRGQRWWTFQTSPQKTQGSCKLRGWGRHVSSSVHCMLPPLICVSRNVYI